MRHAVEVLAAALTVDRQSRVTLTDVVEEGIRLMAKKYKVEINGLPSRCKKVQRVSED